MKKHSYKLGEFFCGPGGIACGAKLSQHTDGEDLYEILPTWASDYDKDTCETYARNIHNKHKISKLS